MLTILGYVILMVIMIIGLICVMYGKTINETTRKWEINGLGIFGYVLASIVIVIILADSGYDFYNNIRVSRLSQLSKPIQSV